MPRVKTSRALYPAGILAIALALPSIASGQQAQFSGGGEGDGGGDVRTAPAGGEGPQARGANPAPARLLLRTEGDGGGTVPVGERVKAIARLKPFVPHQTVEIRVNKGGKLVKRRNLPVKRIGNTNVGIADMSTRRIIRSGRYRISAVHKGNAEQERARKRAPRFRTKYPDLDPGQHNSDVRLFNKLLAQDGYFTSSGKGYGSPTERAVMAFRKVNKMQRSFNASAEIFRKLADDKGLFRLKRPGAGKHVEVDISRQVMVLANRRKAQHIFHVSTGAPATPSDRGSFRFFRRQPGFNSLGMYYSVYYNGGEAIHGYHSVPPYNASHGCIRNPIPNSRFIYNWVKLGMPIYVYG
jgi:hypothetical protein